MSQGSHPAVTSREVRSSRLGIWFLLQVYRWCGQRVTRWLITLVLACIYPWLRQARKASGEYQTHWQKVAGRRFPGGTFRHVLTFAWGLADRLACWQGYFDCRKIRVRTPLEYETMTARYMNGQGGFCLVSHLGNFELLRAIFTPITEKKGAGIHVFMDTAATQGFVNAQRELAPHADVLRLHSIRELDVGMSMRMAQAVEEGSLVIIAGDRHHVASKDLASKGYRMRFLGEEAMFPRGSFRWAGALGCPVYSLFLLESGGRYDLQIRELANGEERVKAEHLVEDYVQHLEEMCLQYPLNWFNFYSFWS